MQHGFRHPGGGRGGDGTRPLSYASDSPLAELMHCVLLLHCCQLPLQRKNLVHLATHRSAPRTALPACGPDSGYLSSRVATKQANQHDWTMISLSEVVGLATDGSPVSKQHGQIESLLMSLLNVIPNQTLRNSTCLLVIVCIVLVHVP